MSYDRLFEYADCATVSLLMALLVTPVIVYLFSGWSVRRSEIVGAMSAAGATLYFQQFYPALAPGKDSVKVFAKHYRRRYGRRHYVLPLVLLSCIAFFLLLITTHTL